MSFSFESLVGVKLSVFGHNNKDKDGNPAGGYVHVAHPSVMDKPNLASIYWQDGPVSREAGQAPNGAFVEDIIAACVERLSFYQKSPFNCPENAFAIEHLKSANQILLERRKDRQARQVEGKHEK